MYVCLSIDADWAHPVVAEYTFLLLDKYRIPYTFFATEDQIVTKSSIIEIAWHPNFLKYDTEEELIKFSNKFPGSKGLRPHRLHFKTNLTPDLFHRYDLQWISTSSKPNQFSPRTMYEGIPDFVINWGDNFWFWRNELPDYNNMLETHRGFYTINFHPIHIYLNTSTQEQYDRAKKNYHDIKYLRTLRNKSQQGVRDVFLQVLSMNSNDKVDFITISNAYSMINFNQ